MFFASIDIYIEVRYILRKEYRTSIYHTEE